MGNEKTYRVVMTHTKTYEYQVTATSVEDTIKKAKG